MVRMPFAESRGPRCSAAWKQRAAPAVKREMIAKKSLLFSVLQKLTEIFKKNEKMY